MSVETGSLLSEQLTNNRNILAVSTSRMRDDGEWFDYIGNEVESIVRGRNDFGIMGYAREGDLPVMADRFTGAVKRYGAQSVVLLDEIKPEDLEKVLNDLQGLLVLGGNTFKLVADVNGARDIYGNLVDKTPGANTANLAKKIIDRVAHGMPFFGYSAGAMLAADYNGTCDDDPTAYVAEYAPGVFKADITGLNLLGTKTGVHPHYEPSHRSTVRRFTADNPDNRMLAMPNGSGIKVEGKNARVVGEKGVILFDRRKTPQRFAPNQGINAVVSQRSA